MAKRKPKTRKKGKATPSKQDEERPVSLQPIKFTDAVSVLLTPKKG